MRRLTWLTLAPRQIKKSTSWLFFRMIAQCKGVMQHPTGFKSAPASTSNSTISKLFFSMAQHKTE
ncbi:hypothetical protein G9C98_006485 [Cotesia typhae]|uniref:Uncharacterized protein n=1 Tax=Cotesia typhae TaxID=2053667 RepID=A0A8J5UUZ0_9HYME|nr:hypothetical protein G9C98_006485 [Cotesia typhae]